MPRDTKKYVEVLPRNAHSKAKLSYHGTRWVFRKEQQEAKFTRIPGPYFVIRSIDGTHCMIVHKTNDPDFIVRYIG